MLLISAVITKNSFAKLGIDRLPFILKIKTVGIINNREAFSNQVFPIETVPTRLD